MNLNNVREIFLLLNYCTPLKLYFVQLDLSEVTSCSLTRRIPKMCSQDPAIDPYHKPGQSSPYHHIP
jgi:hypothetical protein